MSRPIAMLLNPAAGRPLHDLLHMLARCWHELTRDALRPYRPEQHYLRGPRPAWRAKHGGQ